MLFSADAFRDIPSEIPVGSALWGFKHTVEQLEVIEKGDPYTHASQYQQEPSPPGGGMFKDEYWRYYTVLPPDICMYRIYCDTAQKTKEHNDWSVFQMCGVSPSKGIFLIDQLRGKWEAPQLESNLVAFWNKHKPSIYKPNGAQIVKIEDKSSGSSLIQSVKQDYFIPVEGIQRNTDKVLRSMGAVKYFAMGWVHIPEDAPWVSDYKDEFRKFSPMMTHKHDDQIDPTLDAVEDLLVFEKPLYSEEAISK